MPRTVVEDDDDALPLTDLLRTGEASRLRRRGAMRTAVHRRDDEDETSALPLHRRLRVDEVYLELSCGVRSPECSLSPAAGPSRPSPLPRTPSTRLSAPVGFVFSSTGCGSQLSSRALPGSSASHHVYTSTEFISPNISRLPSKYLDAEQRALAEFLTKEDCGCQCEWEAIGCRVCGNALGFLYAPCHPRHSNSQPTYVFFSTSVTSSPSYTFPSIQPHVDSDDMSIDSPTFSPRVTRYFHSEPDEYWPRSDFTWDPNPVLAPTPPRSPGAASTPLAFSVRQAVVPGLTPAPARESRGTNAPPARPEVIHRGSTHFATSREPLTDGRLHTNDWRSYYRPASPRRTPEQRDRAIQNTNDAAHSPEDSQPIPRHGWVPRELRERAPGPVSPSERASDFFGLGLVLRNDTLESNARPVDPPALHRVARRTLVAPTRRPASSDALSWRHFTGPTSPPRSTHATEERTSRGVRPGRRVTASAMPAAFSPPPPPPPPPASVPAPAPPLTPTSDHAPGPEPAFTLFDAAGDRSYPPSARSSLDARDTLEVNVQRDVEEMNNANMIWSRRAESGEMMWNADRGTGEVGGDDGEEKEDDSEERRVESPTEENNAPQATTRDTLASQSRRG